MARQSLVEAAAQGLLAESAMIAHGEVGHSTICLERRLRVRLELQSERLLPVCCKQKDL